AAVLLDLGATVQVDVSGAGERHAYGVGHVGGDVAGAAQLDVTARCDQVGGANGTGTAELQIHVAGFAAEAHVAGTAEVAAERGAATFEAHVTRARQVQVQR